MNIGTVRVSYNRAIPTGLQRITTGMVGATVDFIFDDTWVGCHKTYVWKAGDVIKDDTTASGIVPAEVLTEPGRVLFVGVYGVSGSVATPTLWACLGPVLAGATPSGDESTEPSLPVWAQLQEEIERLKAGGVGGGYVVDDELDENSENPVQNKVITIVFNEALADIESQFADVYAAIPPAITVDDKMDYNSTNPVQNGVVMRKMADIGSTASMASSAAAAAHDRIYELETTAGNINTALDAIIAIQESLIGGDA